MHEYFINDLIEMKDPNVIITKSFTEKGIKHIYIEVPKVLIDALDVRRIHHGYMIIE